MYAHIIQIGLNLDNTGTIGIWNVIGMKVCSCCGMNILYWAKAISCYGIRLGMLLQQQKAQICTYLYMCVSM